MGTAQPIRDAENLILFIDYYKNVHPNLRNYTLIQLGFHTALRISDLLALRWQDVFDEQEGKCRAHVCVIEKKTQKRNKIAVCPCRARRRIELYERLRKMRYMLRISAAIPCARLLAIMLGNRAYRLRC